MTADEGHAVAQEEERDSLAAIFSDDFASLGDDPISYSVRLRPNFAVDGPDENDDGAGALPSNLALAVTYPPDYPDAIPILELSYDRSSSGVVLHEIQERALLNAVIITANAGLGMPSIYSCIMAANEFIESGGLTQAGIAMLSDDCLAQILSYLATSKEDIERICTALPIVEAASKTNIVWRQLCHLRWSEKWGTLQRWCKASAKITEEFDNHFWKKAYEREEADAKRTTLTPEELSSMVLDCRQWFSFNALRNQPDNMRDVLPTGLRESLKTVMFWDDGEVGSVQISQSGLEWRQFLRMEWKVSSPQRGAISEITLTQGGRPVECLAVRRLDSWGWELRGSDYVFRAVDITKDAAGLGGVGARSVQDLWKDLTENIVLEERAEWIVPHRGPYPYNYREIPDDEDCKMLDW